MSLYVLVARRQAHPERIASYGGHCRARMVARMKPVDAAVLFYDHLRAYAHGTHTERGARIQAELYLRRKMPGVDADTAAELLAEALAVRAAAKVNP